MRTVRLVNGGRRSGSLLQILVPVACWWTGQNLLDVALYVNDARALTLVLLGGRTGAEVEGHDWAFILGRLGLLAHDHSRGRSTSPGPS
ncbi:hypothetical protein [Luteitalea sp.]